MSYIHPRDVGFAARYEWHDRRMVTIWRHCNQDAGGDANGVTCLVCGLTTRPKKIREQKKEDSTNE